MQIERSLFSYSNETAMQRLKSEDLGPIIETYRGRRLRWRDIFLIFLPGTLSVIFPVTFGAWENIYGYMRYGPIAASTWGRPWFVLAALSALCLLLLAFIRMYHARSRVLIRKHGLEIYLSPVRRFRLPWSNISGITTSSEARTLFNRVLYKKYTLTLYPTIGKTIKLNQQIPDISNLNRGIKKHLYRRKLPILRNDLQNGRCLKFGILNIDLNNIYHREKQIPWTQVSKFYVFSGYLVIELKDNSSLKLKTSQIHNIELLFQIISREIPA